MRYTGIEPTSGTIFAMRFQQGEISLSRFTTIATLETPRDSTLEDLRIECFLPIDEPTADAFRTWGGG